MTDLIPAARLLPLLDRFEQTSGSKGWTSGLGRRIYKIRHEAEYIEFDAVDRLLVDMDMAYEWHGELADLYEVPGQLKLRTRTGPPGLIPHEKIRPAYTLYRSGVALSQLADLMFRVYGFSSAETCEVILRRAFVRHGFKLRTRSEAARLRGARLLCAGCRCEPRERTPRCMACNQRHADYAKSGRPFLPAVCQGCGCIYEERTRGCGSCRTRHHFRKRKGLPYIGGGCSTCDAPFDRHTPGCKTCASRAKQRRLRDSFSSRQAAPSSPPRRGSTPSLKERQAA